MGLTRTDIYTNTQNRIASLAKVLGHPARVAILQHLLKVNSCICGEIVDVVGLSQPTISQHLKEMKNIGLIQGTIEGTSICYCVNQEVYLEIKNHFEILLGHNFPSASNSCC